jgi:hypothetical protein
MLQAVLSTHARAQGDCGLRVYGDSRSPNKYRRLGLTNKASERSHDNQFFLPIHVLRRRFSAVSLLLLSGRPFKKANSTSMET